MKRKLLVCFSLGLLCYVYAAAQQPTYKETLAQQEQQLNTSLEDLKKSLEQWKKQNSELKLLSESQKKAIQEQQTRMDQLLHSYELTKRQLESYSTIIKEQEIHLSNYRKATITLVAAVVIAALISVAVYKLRRFI